MTKPWTRPLLLLLIPLACERAGDGPIATMPDATPLDARSDAPPGAGNPLEPDQRIDCELEDGYQSNLNVSGVEVSRTRYSYAVAGSDVPAGIPWLCYDAPSQYDCRVAANCEYVGATRHAACVQTVWYLDESGTYYAYCSVQAEVDQDGDGAFEIQAPAQPAHVAVIAVP